MNYKVFATDEYLKEILKWPKKYQEEAQKISKQLSKNPFVGKQLNYPFLREKRIKEKRIYYFVYKDLVLVLLVAAGGKKEQQETINKLKTMLPEFKKYAKELSKQFS
jgi:mRNA-degrading endonuclease RelE of RelBE toxin-antitoxin system